MRVAWRTVGSILERVWDDTKDLLDRFADLTRIRIGVYETNSSFEADLRHELAARPDISPSIRRDVRVCPGSYFRFIE